ncbi:mycofactocin-coupled SDR family oxidoreductase [Nocardia vinacea]|uniref:3-oxoacyl-[acyl-carrier-protein] reductase MabA n=1 Tax=Nocardia vinacea TaxID=96468 RepID=A0ABZ1YTV4_9NOCA|nr:mycofactocin-coupled SDR family oxidoreductase [Nocardia vinacea]
MGEQDGRVAIITGGGRGQGRSHAVTLAEAGANIVVCDIAAPVATTKYPMATPLELAETVELVEKTGQRCISVQADVRRFEDMRRVADLALEEFGRIDILCANAGIMTLSTMADMDDNTWQTMIDINLTGVANSIRAVLPTMVKQGYGRVVATSSGAGRGGYANLSHYSATKWGVIGLIKSVARETGKLGVNLNVVCPTTVPTPLFMNDACHAVFRPDLDNPTIEDCMDRFVGMHAIPVPWIEAQDVSDAILFLVGPRAKNVTGSVFDISAGLGAGNNA